MAHDHRPPHLRKAPLPTPDSPNAKPPSPNISRKLDGSGQPFITLAQLIKREKIVDSGGEAKHRIRAGGILVNGTEELRPGRKLHAGDTVICDGKSLTVIL